MQKTEPVNIKNKSAKPLLLKILCICSFISGVLSALFILFCVLFSGKVFTFFNEYALNDGTLPLNIFIISSVVFFMLFAISVLGTFYLFKQKKKGFYFYLLPNCIFMVLNIIVIYIIFSPLWIIYLLVSIAFILLYASHAKQMK